MEEKNKEVVSEVKVVKPKLHEVWNGLYLTKHRRISVVSLPYYTGKVLYLETRKVVALEKIAEQLEIISKTR